MTSTRRAIASGFVVSLFLASATTGAHAQTARPRPPTTQSSATQPDDDRRVLTTRHFRITITDRRDDPYDITSDHVIYIGMSKRTGKTIRLVGSTFHHMDADGTPGAFQGFIFHNGNTCYRVYESGDLEIRRDDDEILLTDHGTWDR